MNLNNKNSLSNDTEDRSLALHISITIATIYIGIASGLLVFVLQRGKDIQATSYSLYLILLYISSIVIFMFVNEFFMLAIWHKNKISKFGWYGSFCYGIGQTILFVGISFLIKDFGYTAHSIFFLMALILCWTLYYIIRLRNFKEKDYVYQRWGARLLNFFIYAVALFFLFK